MKGALDAAVDAFPRVDFIPWITPIERQPRLSASLGVDLWVKRDDLTGLAFGGNKIRQLEYYFGEAERARADVVLITGAVQSNYVRATAACAARLRMACEIQLEERVAGVDAIYRGSGNVLLSELLGARLHSYPLGEDEAGADASLETIAERLRSSGKNPYVIHLGAAHPPLGALGYIRCAQELLQQRPAFETIFVGSGSGLTHAGLLFGLRALGWPGRVLGVCVRRPAIAQHDRVFARCEAIATLLRLDNPVREADVVVYDDWLAPGYGLMNDKVAHAIDLSARSDGLLVDPVYTGRVMAGVIGLARSRALAPGSRILVMHTGGLPALFGYESSLRASVIGAER